MGGFRHKIRRGARSFADSIDSTIWDLKIQGMEGRAALRRSPLDDHLDDITDIGFLGSGSKKKGGKSQKSLDDRIVDDILSPFTEFERRFR